MMAAPMRLCFRENDGCIPKVIVSIVAALHTELKFPAPNLPLRWDALTASLPGDPESYYAECARSSLFGDDFLRILIAVPLRIRLPPVFVAGLREGELWF